jgi:hypothetical protein
MPTNPPIDDYPINLARKPGRHKSKKDNANVTLEAHIRRHKQAALIPLFGTIDYDPAYNYRRERAKTRLRMLE